MLTSQIDIMAGELASTNVLHLHGLCRTNGGRICEHHPGGCGKALEVDDVVRFRQVIESPPVGIAYAAYKVVEGNDRCRVGWLAEDQPDGYKYNGQSARVTKLFFQSKEKRERRASYLKHGLGHAELLNDQENMPVGKNENAAMEMSGCAGATTIVVSLKRKAAADAPAAGNGYGHGEYWVEKSPYPKKLREMQLKKVEHN